MIFDDSFMEFRWNVNGKIACHGDLTNCYGKWVLSMGSRMLRQLIYGEQILGAPFSDTWTNH